MIPGASLLCECHPTRFLGACPALISCCIALGTNISPGSVWRWSLGCSSLLWMPLPVASAKATFGPFTMTFMIYLEATGNLYGAAKYYTTVVLSIPSIQALQWWRDFLEKNPSAPSGAGMSQGL